MEKRIISFVTLILILAAIHIYSPSTMAQGLTIFGDVRITSDGNTLVPRDVLLLLRRVADGEVARQMVSSRGRYRFTGLKAGEYEIVAEAEGKEIGRLTQIRIGDMILSNSPYGYQNDLEIRWRNPTQPAVAGVISAADVYARSAATQSLFAKAEEAVGKKKYDQASSLLKQVVETDKADFQAWTALGSIYMAQQKFEDAEQSYLQAIEAKPTSARARLNLGRLYYSQKKFDQAIESLTAAVELQPTSGEANYLLGESYLQVKKGSKAIPYLNEAAKLDKPEAHLRLGWLYNAAGMKDKAAIEYEEYLKKNPQYQDRNKLKEYITANKKQ
ncbi:MAG TPA: tetratricopeptide repeat protein [Pyrinomonadaceae bacterium]|nr:tetratricopeptide repeat protein [Pyrinomonadaceae bacterium]